MSTTGNKVLDIKGITIEHKPRTAMVDTLVQVIDLRKADIFTVYREVTSDPRARKVLDFDAVTEVVQRAFEVEFFRIVKRRKAPDDVVRFLEDAKYRAVKNPIELPESPKIKDVIKAALIAGWATPDILDEVYSHHSNARTDAKDVAFYRCAMRKAGELPKFVAQGPAKPAKKVAKKPAKKVAKKKSAAKRAAKKSAAKPTPKPTPTPVTEAEEK